MSENKPRLIGRKEAAAYCGIAESTFSMWVASYKMPQPIPGTRKWDKRAIDAKLDEISGLRVNDNEDPYEKWMRENGGNSPPVSAYRLERDNLPPPRISKLGLSFRQEAIILFMADHPECDTADSIPGAGERTLDKLIDKGAVRLVGTEKKKLRYALTDDGKAEVRAIRGMGG